MPRSSADGICASAAAVELRFEQLHVHLELLVVADDLVVDVAPSGGLLGEVGGVGHVEHMAEVANERGCGLGVLGVHQVVGHPDTQRHRGQPTLLEGGLQHTDDAGDSLVARSDEPEPCCEICVRRAAGDRRGARVRDCLGAGSDRDHGFAAERLRDEDDGVDVGLPVKVGFDADQTDDVTFLRVALQDELVGGPHDLSDVVVDRHVWSLLGEVVERVGIDRSHDDGTIVVDEGVDRLRGGTGHVEPPLQPDEQHRPIERSDVAGAELENLRRIHEVESASEMAMRRSAQRSDDVIDRGCERFDVRGFDCGEHRHPKLVAAELAVGEGVEDAVGSEGLGDHGGVDRFVEIDRPTTFDRFDGSVTNADAQSRASAQSYRMAADVALRPAAKSIPPLSSIHCTCASSMTSVASAGVLYVWFCTELSSRDLEIQRRRPPSVALADQPDALQCGRRAGGKPEAAVGGKALLWCEVVHVDLGWIPAQAPGAEVASTATSAVSAVVPAGRRRSIATPVEVSLWVRA